MGMREHTKRVFWNWDNESMSPLRETLRRETIFKWFMTLKEHGQVL